MEKRGREGCSTYDNPAVLLGIVLGDFLGSILLQRIRLGLALLLRFGWRWDGLGVFGVVTTSRTSSGYGGCAGRGGGTC